jgi:hypothetical protein
MTITPAPLWLGGCGPGSPASQREKLRAVYLVEVRADYQTVYEQIVRRARQRYVFPPSPRHQPGVSADLFPESQSAEVTLWDSGGIGLRYRLSARIRATGPSETHVELCAAGKADAREAQLWALWASTPLED